jgi:nucleoid DNA-binding protein
MREREALAVVDALLHSIERALSDGNSVTLRGFGRFEVRRRAGRKVRAPGSARTVEIPARLSPVFHGAPGLGRRLTSCPGTNRPATGRPATKKPVTSRPVTNRRVTGRSAPRRSMR